MKLLEEKIIKRIINNKDSTFIISDFTDLSDNSSISKALIKISQKSNIIVKVGRGVYVRAKVSKVNGKIIPEKDLRSIAIELLNKLGIKIYSTEYENKYNNSKTTQVPTGKVIGVNKKIKRKIGFNGHYINFKKVKQ